MALLNRKASTKDLLEVNSNVDQKYPAALDDKARVPIITFGESKRKIYLDFVGNLTVDCSFVLHFLCKSRAYCKNIYICNDIFVCII